MNPEEQIAALKHIVETREDQLRRVMDELEEWKNLVQGWRKISDDRKLELEKLLLMITRDRSDRINQFPPEYARGITTEGEFWQCNACKQIYPSEAEAAGCPCPMHTHARTRIK